MPILRVPSKPRPEELPEDIPGRVAVIDALMADAAELLKEYPDVKKNVELRLYLSERVAELTRMRETYQRWMEPTASR